MMRRKNCFLLFFVFALSAAPGIFGADRAASSQTKNLISRLEKGIAPFRSMDIQLETLEDPVIVRKPMVVCHLDRKSVV